MKAKAKTKPRMSELSEALMAQARAAGLDERAEEFAHRAEELAHRLRESEAARQTMATARKMSDEGMDRLGSWLSSGKRAEMLGVRPARRGLAPWFVALLGVAVGYALGVLTAPRRGEEMRQDLTGRFERMTQEGGGDGLPAQKPIADAVRTRLGEDPRTSSLPKLNINVAEGTVFVRGSVPRSADEDAIREVVTSVPGVADVDLQVTVAG